MKTLECPTCKGSGKIENKKYIYVYIGEQIRKRREKLNLSQEDIAKKVGMARASMSNIEAAKQKLPLSTLSRIADVLGCSVKDILPN